MKKIKIKSIRKLEKRNDRYDLTINDTNNFFANGILIHNTSHRLGYLKQNKENFIFKIMKWFGYTRNVYKYIHGSRRVILGDNALDSYYKEEFRGKATEKLVGKLREGETVFLEICGWVSNEKTIMPTHDITKLKDKALEKKYGKSITYSYGTNRGEQKIFVYRITRNLPDGTFVEYSWDQVKSRCREMGVDYTPEIKTILYDGSQNLLVMAEELSSGESVVDPRHIEEGVCFRIEHENTISIYKHKSFEFKVMEDIAKLDENVVDIEESS